MSENCRHGIDLRGECEDCNYRVEYYEVTALNERMSAEIASLKVRLAGRERYATECEKLALESTDLRQETLNELADARDLTDLLETDLSEALKHARGRCECPNADACHAKLDSLEESRRKRSGEVR